MSSIDLLVERADLAAFVELLTDYGFYRIGTGSCTSSTVAFKYLGYCENCSDLMCINVVTDIALGKHRGSFLNVTDTQAFLSAAADTDGDRVRFALDVVSDICSAALLYEYEVRSRRKLMQRARHSAALCST